ncbi:hypothetical protein [Nonomuraea sp. KM90]|uniref:hypothetical protein n=1 Tax=Nonomuraea sp. KM90 TaxID=3457428 RepID=UPI003FCCA77B
MKANVIRYQTRGPEEAENNQRLIEGVFAELAEQKPEGLRYAAFRLADGLSFMHVVVAEEGDDALTGLASFKEFQRAIGDRIVGPPQLTETTVVGAYRILAE